MLSLWCFPAIEGHFAMLPLGGVAVRGVAGLFLYMSGSVSSRARCVHTCALLPRKSFIEAWFLASCRTALYVTPGAPPRHTVQSRQSFFLVAPCLPACLAAEPALQTYDHVVKHPPIFPALNSDVYVSILAAWLFKSSVRRRTLAVGTTTS